MARRRRSGAYKRTSLAIAARIKGKSINDILLQILVCLAVIDIAVTGIVAAIATRSFNYRRRTSTIFGSALVVPLPLIIYGSTLLLDQENDAPGMIGFLLIFAGLAGLVVSVPVSIATTWLISRRHEQA